MTKRIPIEELPSAERRSVATAAREYVGTHRIAETQKQSAKKRHRKPGKLHKPGSHWYELEAYFDPHLIEATPVADSGFMMGVLEDMVVVEVEADWSTAQIHGLGMRLSEIGIKALVVRKGIRFLRLRGCAPEQGKQLDELLQKQQQEVEAKSAEGSESTPADAESDNPSG